jgi:hypothetical protein
MFLMSDIADFIENLKPVHYWVGSGFVFIMGTNYAEYESVMKWNQEHHNTSLIHYREIRKEETRHSLSSKALFYLGTAGREYAIHQLQGLGRK